MPSPLDHPPAKVVREWIVGLGLGAMPPATPWPVYYANEPGRKEGESTNAPDSVIVVTGTEGRSEGWTQPDSEMSGYFGFQVMVRAASNDVGYAKASAIADNMDKNSAGRTVSIGATEYLIDALNRTTQVLELGKAEDNLYRFAVNGDAEITKQ